MRLFIAINFSNEIKDALCEAQTKLKTLSSANYSSRDNLHCTLAFIGECDRKKQYQVMLAMDNVRFSSFEVAVEGNTKCMEHHNEKLLFAEIAPADKLTELAALIKSALNDRGIELESREFIPHITIARRFPADINTENISINKSVQNVDGISLMLSERVQGRLVYKELYTRIFR